MTGKIEFSMSMRHIIILWGFTSIVSGAAACSDDGGTPGVGGTAGSGLTNASSGTGGGSSGTGGATSSGGLAGGGGQGGAQVDPCEPVAGVSYVSSTTAGDVSDRPALELRPHYSCTGSMVAEVRIPSSRCRAPVATPRRRVSSGSPR